MSENSQDYAQKPQCVRSWIWLQFTLPTGYLQPPILGRWQVYVETIISLWCVRIQYTPLCYTSVDLLSPNTLPSPHTTSSADYSQPVSRGDHRVHILVKMKQGDCICPLSRGVHCNLVREVRGWKGVGVQPPTLTSQGWFFDHDGMYARIGNRHSVCTLRSEEVTKEENS